MKQTPKKTIALGMSGGVDSSLCAHLLVEQGYDVTGVYMECWRAPGCRSEEDRKDALSVALSLDIPFVVLDFKKEYKEKVVEYFFREYERGRTPNPDVLCNVEIKFGLFFDWAQEQNFDYIATGHYAKKVLSERKAHLHSPRDTWKDQTYFLHQITQEQLRHTIFPLDNMTKDEVRSAAKKRDIHVSDKKDSVGICFIGDINVHEFLAERLGTHPGDVVDIHGNIIGSHKGLWFYTVGQRSGFTVHQTSIVQNQAGEVVTKQNIPPFYVIEKKPKENQLVVGFGAQTLRDSFPIGTVHWIAEEPTTTEHLLVRIRHTGSLLPATLKNNTVHLNEPTKGIADGQFAVFYAKRDNTVECLGGAEILFN